MVWGKIGGAIALLATLAAAGAQAQHTGGSWGPGYWDGPWHGWFMGPLMMLVYLAIIAGVIIIAIRWLGLSGSSLRPGSRSGDPIEILRERFARGEIDKEEFDERRRALED
jgi:putative membrane protein